MEDKLKAIVVGVKTSLDKDYEENVQELVQLVEVVNIEVVNTITQNLPKLNPVTYVGPGKLEELNELINSQGIDVVVFEGELSPKQLKNINKTLDCDVLDRTTIILDIFAQRAQTKEAQLQVLRAEYKYMLPRILDQPVSFDRQRGGGMKNRGAGETRKNLDKQLIRRNIYDIDNQLKEISKQKQQQRKKRDSGITPQVALVGYTNAGKSTIMNAVLKTSEAKEEKEVFVKDMVFATLDTTSRKIELENNFNFILSDTVGFINKLPDHLLRSFETTLSEVKYADLILHVVDVSSENKDSNEKVTLETLDKIGVKDTPIITVYNKKDLTDYTFENTEDKIYISAYDEKDIGLLIDAIKNQLTKQDKMYKLWIPYDKGNVLSYLMDNVEVLDTQHEEMGTLMFVKCSAEVIAPYSEFIRK